MNILITLLSLTVCALAAPSSGTQRLVSTLNTCKRKPAELFFLLDSSSSIWIVDFRKQLKFVSDLVENFDIGPNSTRVGVAAFSHYYYPIFGLNSYDNVQDIQTAIQRIRHYLGNTYTYDALEGVRTRGLSKDVVRPGVQKIVIVLTDGESQDYKRTVEAAKKIKEEALVFAIGIGSRTDRAELTAIASEPTEKFKFEVGNYGLLDIIKEQLVNSACEAKEDLQQEDEPEDKPICGAKASADVIFAVNDAELHSAHTTEIYQFIGQLTTEFNRANGSIQVGLETSRCGGGDILLGEYTHASELSAAISSTRFSRMSGLVKRLRTHSFKAENGARIRARRMAVLFVDDKLYNSKEVLEEAARTKRDDVELFVVAIGDSVVEEQLEALVSSTADRHIIRVQSYENLKLSLETFLEKFCHGL